MPDDYSDRDQTQRHAATTHPDLIGPTRELLEGHRAAVRDRERRRRSAHQPDAVAVRHHVRARGRRISAAPTPPVREVMELRTSTSDARVALHATATVMDVTGGGRHPQAPHRQRPVDRPYKGTADSGPRRIMGIDWMTRNRAQRGDPARLHRVHRHTAPGASRAGGRVTLFLDDGDVRLYHGDALEHAPPAAGRVRGHGRHVTAVLRAPRLRHRRHGKAATTSCDHMRRVDASPHEIDVGPPGSVAADGKIERSQPRTQFRRRRAASAVPVVLTARSALRKPPTNGSPTSSRCSVSAAACSPTTAPCGSKSATATPAPARQRRTGPSNVTATDSTRTPES